MFQVHDGFDVEGLGEKVEPGDPGSPWAIGAAEGGHTAMMTPGAGEGQRGNETDPKT